MRVRIGAVLWIASALSYVIAETVAAAAMGPDYDYLLDYVSDLGQPSASPHATLMNAAFLVQAVAFPVGAVATLPANSPRKALPYATFAALNGIGNVLVAVVHSGSGATAHAVGAVLSIVGGNAAILAYAVAQASGRRRTASLVVGAVGLVSFAAFAIGLAPVGAWERTSIYAIYLWQAASGVLLLTSRARAG